MSMDIKIDGQTMHLDKGEWIDDRWMDEWTMHLDKGEWIDNGWMNR